MHGRSNGESILRLRYLQISQQKQSKLWRRLGLVSKMPMIDFVKCMII